MSSVAALVFAALALLCVAGALLVLHRGAQHKGQVSTERFIDSRLAATQTGGPGLVRGATVVSAASGSTRIASVHGPVEPQPPASGSSWQVKWQYLGARVSFVFATTMSRAGISDARIPALIAVAISVSLCLWAAHEGGALAAVAMLTSCVFVLYFLISWRSHKRRQLIVRQLPSFLDGIVRLIVLGNSVPAAFQASLQTTDAPLRECLDHVSRMLRTGVEIDRALYHVSRIYRASELELVGAVLRLSVKYGGRADVMLDRMASFMRDLEQAERELTAMTAETKLSSFVLALLPVGIGSFLILNNPAYFGAMWYDPTGRNLVYLAFGLQLLGAWLLYRLARLRK
ncbi:MULTISPECIES: type II secretion system F family protein [Paraburkholderia]|uniref:type II secretion system F family protein n=1 Tax=Paraburkholderia TaxID=1822464 RepID=UPI00225B3D08|nr:MULTISPECIES: type II secretion system F family protein [Paraburkholderia]MCX4164443.1 type II secretion system F family protein [Paraburkholderia megapolitana]MDN7159936.1 type II secretion system F family protein [Paraburkholderia sp. CHISQ3]MDQ6496983.1 type II secretion system F family protein [Paraburkholderia megapolitana]